VEESLNTFQNKLEAGVSLISKPELLDPSFLMSVTLICEHNEDGSFGLVLNRLSNLYLNPLSYDLSDELTDGCYQVFIGGPVQLDSVFYLFRSDKEYEGAKKVVGRIYLGYSKDLLNEILPNIKKEDIFFFIGYAGWSFYQLDCEFSSGSWFSHNLSEEFVFRKEKTTYWLDSLAEIGPDFHQLGQAFFNKFDN
jgi:putative transcriptional regulator